MTSLEALFAEEAATRRLEAGRKRNFRVALYCMILAAGFAILDWGLIATTELRQFAYWRLVIVFSFIPLALAGIAVMAWYFVHRDRRRLVQLRVIAAQEDTFEQTGVWPPPPDGPKG